MLGSNDIIRHNIERLALDDQLTKLGREVAEFRGEPVRGYFEKWELDRDDETATTITVYFEEWWQGGCETYRVSFPIIYLDPETDWKSIEQQIKDEAADVEKAKRAADRERRAAAKIARAAKKEQAERAQLAELQAKYGGQS